MKPVAGTLLGGRLRYLQPEDGYRTGIEPVLLASAIPARPGQRVLEAGTGAGAGLMCLAARVSGLTGVGVEIDPQMAELARSNIAANDLPGLEIITGAIGEVRLSGFDHAFANPPWHDSRSTPSPVGRRRLAKQAPAEGLDQWIATLARAIGEEGTLTLILPASAIERAQRAVRQAGLSPARLIRLLPKEGRASKLTLLAAERRPRAAPVEEHGLILHCDDGRYRPEIEAVLRDGAALPKPG